MAERTLTLRSDLVDKIESLAQAEGRTPDDIIGGLLKFDEPPLKAANEANQWLLDLAVAMEAEDIEWKINDPNASVNSREEYKKYVYEKWLRTQNRDSGDE